MQPLDDIAALAKRVQTLLGVLGQNPARWTGWLGETQPLERPHPTNPDLPQWIARNIAAGTKIDNALSPSRFSGEHPVEPCPAFCGHFRLKATSNLQLRSWTKLACDEVAGAGAQTRCYIVAADHEVGPVISAAPHKDMNMRMLGVPMFNGHPVEPRAEVAGGLVHQFPRKASQA